MNETVLVEFLLPLAEVTIWSPKMESLGNEFQLLRADDEYESDGNIAYLRYTGKISSEYASLIKLQDPYLSGCMRVSYISDELKNKYRK